MTMRSPRESWIFTLTLLSAAAALVSIAASEILLAGACLLWIVIRPRPVQMPAYTLPLVAFMLTTVLSFAMSPDRSVGGHQIGKFVLFPMGLLAANFISDFGRVKLTFKILLVVAAVGSATSIVQFVLKERRFLETQAVEYDPMVLDRVKGFMGHWMTFSGGQLLVWCAVLPLIVLIGRRWIIPLSMIGIAIIFSFTRGAWLGSVFGIAVASFWIPRRQLVRLIVPILVVSLLASPFIYHRVSMTVQGQSGGDVGRLKLLKVGLEMVRAHPLFGVGLERIPAEFPNYYKGNDLNTFYIGHMQNDFMQIAAERGLICLAAFLWFLFVLYRSLWGFAKSGDETRRLTAVSAMCALTGFLVMGLSEFNFGDSEPLILFLFIVSIPFGMSEVFKRPVPRVP
jgi:O-antigen ligase